MQYGPGVKVLTAALVVVGALVAVGTLVDLTVRGGRGLRAIYERYPGRRRRLYRSLARLAPGVQIGYFEQLLGVAVFKNTGDATDEFVFVHRDAYVQAVATKDGRVEFFAVTARTPRFRPPIWGRTVYWSLDLTSAGYHLGRFAFDQLPMAQRPDGVRAYIGARRFQYVEAYYFGNPGLYQTYLLAMNDAGDMKFPELDLLALFPGPETSLGRLGEPGPETEGEMENFLGRPDVAAFRRQATPNTYAVLGPQADARAALPTWIGPNLDQVRTLLDEGPTRA